MELESALAEAGPSRSYQHAPLHPLPSTAFYSIEYPGYVKPSSVSLAVRTLGGQACLNRALKRNATKSEALLELNLRPDNPFSHPIPGDVVGTNNILLKITKKKRRVTSSGADGTEHIGDFVAEAVGVISKTVRFRGMVDFQYTPDMSDPVVQLRQAMDRMDVQAIKNYVIPPEKEDFSIPVSGLDPALDPQLSEAQPEDSPQINERSNLRLLPPPIFSRQGIPQFYNYKANNMSVVTTVVDSETGVETKRLINKSRWKGYGPAAITFAEPTVPTRPLPNVEASADQADKRILALLVKLFEERPIWIRLALNNHFSAVDAREIYNSKILIPLVCYVFQDGPWRDTLIRFGYDPREDPSARFYQRLYFRNLNHRTVRPSVVSRRQEGRFMTTMNARNLEEQEQGQDTDRSQGHIFDGVTLTKETPVFQLCDIHDPMLKEMIEDDDGLRDVCNERDGWYTTHALERIKTVLRHKFFSLLEGHVATDQECLVLLQPKPGSSAPPTSRDQRRRPGKHNMAKGALSAEEAALARLRATLDNNARKFSARGRIPE